MDHDKMSNLYKGPFIDASYQVSVHLAGGFHIFVSDWSISKKSSSLKPPGQMNQNLVGSILGRSSINIFHLVLIR
jgi:hypothetical protein